MLFFVRSFDTADTEDETADSGSDDDTTAPTRKGNSKGKRKGKGKGKEKAARGGGASANHVGERVRVFFPSPHNNFFHGTVGADK